MNNIRIVFEADKGIVPKIIRYLTKSDVNHVALEYWSEDWHSDMSFEAVTSGVRTKPSYSRNWKYQFKILKSVENNMRIEKDLLGKKYDWKALLLYGWILLFWKWFKVKLRKPTLRAKDQFCSELVARVLWSYIWHNMIHRDPQWVTPEDLLRICRARTDLFEEVK